MREAQFGYEVREAMEKVVQKVSREMHMGNHHFSRELGDQSTRFENHDAKILNPEHPEFEPRDSVGASFENQDETSFSSSSDIESDLVGIEIRKDLSGDLDPRHLDSLLSVHFKQRGIEPSFVFAVYNSAGAIEIQSEKALEYIDALANESILCEMRLPGWGTEAFQLQVFFPELRSFLFHNTWGLMFLSILVMVVSLSAIVFAGLGLIRQNKLSKVKTDFINNMTHELKTPISTISLACEALGDPDMQRSDDSRKLFVNMISEENKRLGTLVENVLRTAQLDQGEIKLKKSAVNMHEIVVEVSRNLAIQVVKHRGTIRHELEASDPIVSGDRIHLTNVVYNLLDNAMKYSAQEPIIAISSKNTEGHLELTFADNGIGIGKEHRKKIFDPLYRIPTGDVHNVKGFGLGLSYVKTIIEKHHGNITVQSELQKGSKFIIQLPLYHE